MVPVEQFLEKARIPLEEGWGYIYGTAGILWTKELQEKMNRTTEEKYAKSRKYGAKWIGKKVTDCSGLIRQALLLLGEKVAHHATYLYTDYCRYKGKLVNGAPDDGHIIRPGTLVFLKGSKPKIHHVGVYDGGDICIEAKGVEYGVVTSDLSHWDYWGELECVDYSGDISTYQPSKESGFMKATVNCTGAWLNVRSNAGTQYPALFKLSKGDIVDVLDNSEKDWWQISYNGRIGWASTRYLVADVTTEEPVQEEKKGTYSKAELVNLVQLMRASINGLYDELDRLDEMVNKL